MISSVYYRNKKLEIPVHKTGFFRRGVGLMFRSKETENLLFEFHKEGKVAITSVFCFFPFLAVWIDSKNKVVETKIVNPFKLAIIPRKPFKKLIELPLNAKNRHFIEFLVGK